MLPNEFLWQPEHSYTVYAPEWMQRVRLVARLGRQVEPETAHSRVVTPTDGRRWEGRKRDLRVSWKGRGWGGEMEAWNRIHPRPNAALKEIQDSVLVTAAGACFAGLLLKWMATVSGPHMLPLNVNLWKSIWFFAHCSFWGSDPWYCSVEVSLMYQWFSFVEIFSQPNPVFLVSG